MSATPRPWCTMQLTISDPVTKAVAEETWCLATSSEELIAKFERGDDALFAQRAVDAFDALLAVAKVAARGDLPEWEEHLNNALDVLDAHFAGWREWK